MIEKHIFLDEEKLHKEILDELEERYTLCYIGYNDVVPAKIVEQCIEQKNIYPLTKEDYYAEMRRWNAKNALEEILKEKENNPYSVDQINLFRTTEEYQNMLEEIECRDDSTPTKDALLQTRIQARVELHSNFDCWLPLWETKSLYLKDNALNGMLAALSLNPSKVKGAALRRNVPCEGRWPHLPLREGKELVGYDEFIDVLVECGNYGLWTFVGLLDMRSLYENNFETDDLIIPKGSTCTVYNSWNGGGSLSETKTLRDISIKELKRRLSRYKDAPYVLIDEKGCGSGYSTAEVYGEALSHEKILT